MGKYRVLPQFFSPVMPIDSGGGPCCNAAMCVQVLPGRDGAQALDQRQIRVPHETQTGSTQLRQETVG